MLIKTKQTLQQTNNPKTNLIKLPFTLDLTSYYNNIRCEIPLFCHKLSIFYSVNQRDKNNLKKIKENRLLVYKKLVLLQSSKKHISYMLRILNEIILVI